MRARNHAPKARNRITILIRGATYRQNFLTTGRCAGEVLGGGAPKFNCLCIIIMGHATICGVGMTG